MTQAKRPVSLSDRAYHTIRDRILNGNLALGAPLSRRRLAAELGMSLLPVSEAMNRLENEGLIESRARIGTRVCQPTPEDVLGQFEVREALEAQAARLFATKAGARKRRELEAMAAEVDELYKRRDAGKQDPSFLYKVRRRHLEFHLRIADGTGCRALRRIIERNNLLVFLWLFDIAAQRPPLPPRHHRSLAEALSRGTPEETDRAMRDHIRHGLEAIMRAFEEAQDRDAPPRSREGRSHSITSR